MDAFQTILKFLMNQKTTIGYSFMALLTVGGERLFSVVAFKCPCSSQNFTYGLMFLFTPALVLLILGYFLSSRMWKLIMGCCLNPRKLCPRGNRCRCAYVFAQITTGALVAPIMWLSVALLNGTFYECAASGLQSEAFVKHLCKNKTTRCHQELPKVPCGKTTIPELDSDSVLLMLRAQSQVIGWSLIAITAVVALVSTCYVNCRSQFSYIQMKFWRLYIEQEKQKFEHYATEYASKLAGRNLESFFGNKEVEPIPIPSDTAWQAISSLYTFNRNEQFYSTLHRYVEQGKKGTSDTSEEMETVLDFVDGK
ncbi:calcium homeostasis modulator protein 5 [Latimeria chalumnae]|uniref:Calcium homeostasis modulator family member 5 n=1 Tax=Latimeria chalumnae TaxID=7897 RepID=H2ZYD0_LATCH|nr:PREDICTED: protein FAM26E [Latimeria chalumnae]|eukprot:XP_006013091.1 PREDICTED: protein FAM26E [Latimeria chalumnae]